MINRIENIFITVPITGIIATWSTALDPLKAVVMIWGGNYNVVQTAISSHDFAYAWIVYPVWGSLSSQSISLGWAETPEGTGNVSLQIIEYI